MNDRQASMAQKFTLPRPYKPVFKLMHRLAFSAIGSRCLILVMAIFCATGCGDIRQADKHRLPSISKSRPLGSECGPQDSASIKRFAVKSPLTLAGWSYGGNDFIDSKRTKNVSSNSLTRYRGSIVGYVKFDKPGYLQGRVYDDVYGDVFVGWSPRKLELKSSQQPAYISMGLCENCGDDQVQELCWFPAGSQKGVLIFSTSHPDPGEKLTPADLYGSEQLGNQYQFFDNVAADTLFINFRDGKLDKAQSILNDSEKLLSSMRDAVNGSSGKPIPQKEFNAKNWAMLRTYELGLALGEPSFNAKKKALEEVLNGPHWPVTTNDPLEREYRDMLPIYNWLNEQLVSKKSELPKFDANQDCLAGHDPKAVAAYLQADSATEGKLIKSMFNNIEFWIAVKNFLRKDYKNADKQLNKFFETSHGESDAFEVAAAAKLRDFEFFELHPEK